MTYTKDGKTSNGKILYLADKTIINPTEEQLLAAGWVKVVAQEPSEEELARLERESRIAQLKDELSQSDYKALKYAEGWISEEDYAPIKAERQSIRDEINTLEEAI